MELLSTPLNPACVHCWPPRGETALHKAASQRHCTVCRLLIDGGAALNKPNFQVERPSHITENNCSAQS